MPITVDKVTIDTFYEHLLLGMTKILGKTPRVKHVRLVRMQPSLPLDIACVELEFGVLLPADLRNLYLATNGFRLTWKYAFTAEESVRVGLYQINAIENLKPVKGYKVYENGKIGFIDNKPRLYPSKESVILYLAEVDDCAKVCLVYPKPEHAPTIWLMDEDNEFHYLTKRFRTYMRMGIVHLGVPYWQFSFTSIGLPIWVEEMFGWVLPHLPQSKPIIRKSPTKKAEPKKTNDKSDKYLNQLDANIFKFKLRRCKYSANLRYCKNL